MRPKHTSASYDRVKIWTRTIHPAEIQFKGLHPQYRAVYIYTQSCCGGDGIIIFPPPLGHSLIRYPSAAIRDGRSRNNMRTRVPIHNTRYSRPVHVYMNNNIYVSAYTLRHRRERITPTRVFSERFWVRYKIRVADDDGDETTRKPRKRTVDVF